MLVVGTNNKLMWVGTTIVYFLVGHFRSLYNWVLDFSWLATSTIVQSWKQITYLNIIILL